MCFLSATCGRLLVIIGSAYLSETKFYYLQSRYYDPETSRFLNADDIVPDVNNKSGRYNIYEYCQNNPIMYIDSVASAVINEKTTLYSIFVVLSC